MCVCVRVWLLKCAFMCVYLCMWEWTSVCACMFVPGVLMEEEGCPIGDTNSIMFRDSFL